MIIKWFKGIDSYGYLMYLIWAKKLFGARDNSQGTTHFAVKYDGTPTVLGLPPCDGPCSTHLHRALETVNMGDFWKSDTELTRMEYGGLRSWGVSSPSSGALGTWSCHSSASTRNRTTSPTSKKNSDPSSFSQIHTCSARSLNSSQ